MIVRIMGEGQYRVPDEALERLNELDDALEAALADDQAFRPTLAALLESVRNSGSRLPDAELLTSDVVLPAAEATVDEVRSLLTDEGLIPD
jgi:PspA-Associated protein